MRCGFQASCGTRGSENWPPFLFNGIPFRAMLLRQEVKLIAPLSILSLSSKPLVHLLTLTCQVHCGPLAPLPGTGWTGPPCHSAENGGSERRQLSDVGERMTPSGKDPILQVRKATWQGVDRDLTPTLNLRALSQSNSRSFSHYFKVLNRNHHNLLK